MAKYQVTYSCGHDGDVHLYGRTADRENKLRWFEKDALCPDCYTAKRDRDFDQANRDAATANAEAALPALTGSERQIAWAESIRRDQLAAVAALRLGVRADKAVAYAPSNDPRWAQLDNACRAEVAAIHSQASAKWWIDTRHQHHASEILRRLRTLMETLFAVEIQRAKVDLAAEQTESERARDAERRAAAQTADDRSESAAFHFRPLRLERSGENFIVYGDDNHAARGYIDGAQWIVYQVDNLDLNTLLPNAIALGARVKSLVTGARKDVM